MTSARACLTAVCVACVMGAQAAPPLEIMQQDKYPRVFFFRSSEAAAKRESVTYEQWDAAFSRLMGIEGKVLDEESPGHLKRNPQFFTRFKREHPEQLVLLHICGCARDPRFRTEKYFAGHWVYYNGAKITAAVPAQAGETDIAVSDTSVFNAKLARASEDGDDVGLCMLNAEGKPDWSRSEQVRLLSIDKDAKTIRVKRGLYGSTPLAFPAGGAYAAAHVSEPPSGSRVSDWCYNHALTCPRDANGKSCNDLLVDEVAAYFAPGGLLENFDGMVFDVLKYDIPRSASPVRGADCDADGVRDNGVVGGKNVYGVGVIEFARALREKIGDGKLMMADGMDETNQRAVNILNGIESEGWPVHRDSAINDWSGGINRHLFWNVNARPPVFNYINHKYISPGGGAEKRKTVPFTTHRLVFAAGHCLDAAFCYSYEPPRSGDELVGIWDEFWKGTAHEIGWLGKPAGPTRRLAAEQPDVFKGAGAPASETILAKLSGANMKFEIEKGMVKVTGAGDATQLDFFLSDVPCDGPDIVLGITAHGGPLPDYPPDMPRLMKVKSVEGVKKPKELMTWVNARDFASTFYYGDVTAPKGRFEITVEGTGPVWLTLTGHAYPDAIAREFERGAVVANPSLHDCVFDLAKLFPGKHFRRIQGSPEQDPKTNNGAAVGDALTIGSKDGLFMVKESSTPTQNAR